MEAVKATGVRAILATGWGGLTTGKVELPDNVLGIETASHGWLFPKMSAVVHDGGRASSRKADDHLSVFCRSTFLGARVHELGVGPKPILQKILTVEKLCAAIRQVTTDKFMCRRADAIGQRIRSEDGVANAVACINRLMKP